MKTCFCLAVLILPCLVFAQEAPSDSLKTTVLDQLVVMATRSEESLLQAPASVVNMNQQFIRQSAQPGFFDAIVNLKGVQVITPSLGFKVINARGFAHTTNV